MLLAEARRELGEGATSSIAIATLGGFRVNRDGEPVDVGEWGSRKARDLVKLLVARRGAPVVRDEVTELLWPDEPDRSARRLSVLLSTVRTVFDPLKAQSPDHFVAADHDTVWLVRDHVDIDVEQFLAEAAEGRRMLAGGDRERGRGAARRLPRRATSASSAPTIRTPIGRPGCARWPSTRSSTRVSSWPASPTPTASTARRSATGCAPSTSIPTTRTPTSA